MKLIELHLCKIWHDGRSSHQTPTAQVFLNPDSIAYIMPTSPAVKEKFGLKSVVVLRSVNDSEGYLCSAYSPQSLADHIAKETTTQ